MKIIIPMAGRGSRFQNLSDIRPEYAKPKPFIEVLGKPMILWAIESLPFIDFPGRPADSTEKIFPDSLIFICLREHEEKFNISKKLKKLFSPKINTVIIPDITRGALETALLAEKFLHPDDDILISDSDHYFDGYPLHQAILKKGRDTAGIIPVDRPVDKEVKHSYSLSYDDKTAVKVAEKDPELARLGAYSNIGAYYFSSSKIFLKFAKKSIKTGEMSGPVSKKEFYIAPLYQKLLDAGLTVEIAVTKNAWRLGTPGDLEFFLDNFRRNAKS